MHKITVLGKIPPPFIGTSIWFDILRKSSLNNEFSINWFNVNVHRNLISVGKNSFSQVFKNLQLYVNFYRSLVSHKPEIVLIPISQSTIGFLKDSIFIRLALRKSKVVLILHGSNLLNWMNGTSYLMKRYFSGTIAQSCAVIVLGENLKSLFLQWFPEDRIFSVPNGISPEMAIGSDKRDRPGDTIILRYIGNIIKAKGILDVLNALKLIGKEKIVLRINGEWPDLKLKGECERLIRENELPVIIEGHVSGIDKWRAYINSDIFVFTPNKPEGLPLVIIEAMAAGLPIISTDQGAITQAVRDSINGFIVKSGSPDQIAGKIKFLVDNPEKRIEMGEAGRRLHAGYFTEEKMIDNYKGVFNILLRDTDSQ